MDIRPMFSALTIFILLGAAFSFLVVSSRYPTAIKRALYLQACGSIATAMGSVVTYLPGSFWQPLTQPLPEAAGFVLGAAGTCFYYVSYRSLQNRVFHLPMVAALFALTLLTIIASYAIANANIGLFAICALDVVLFGLTARDVLMNLRGHGRAHVIQGVGLALLAVCLGSWGAGFLFIPASSVVTIQYNSGDVNGLAVGLIGNSFSAAFGALIFVLMCNDEFNLQLLNLVATDPLTGVANRRKLMERAEEEVSRAQRYNQPLTVVMIDLDHFKKLNDTHGHAAGDQVLKTAAQACVAALRDIDLMARSGGEEFAVLLPQTPLARGLEVAERLRQAMARIEVPLGEIKITFTASLGVAELAPGDTSIDHVMARADRALYRSKAGGRNQISHEIPEITGVLATQPSA
ncbi:MAG TPA: GGDEF domain-containing protein [Magnetospirillaceae bacterium]|jgi:diguanylate cyclase (GGDEF)-like protein